MFKINQKQLNVKVSEKRSYQSFCRIHGELPIFISQKVNLAKKLVENAHIITIQGRLILRMAKIRSERWVTRLQQLVNKTEKSCVEGISS